MHQNSSFLAKNLLKTNWAKNKKIVNQVNFELIHLRKAVNKKEIRKNKNPH